jgi:Uncharacterized protein, 4-oxalocrotonate tautomerase homolog
MKMPVITIQAANLSIEQKRELAKTLTKSASDIIKAPEQAFTVLIKEIDKENIGVGGILASDK